WEARFSGSAACGRLAGAKFAAIGARSGIRWTPIARRLRLTREQRRQCEESISRASCVRQMIRTAGSRKCWHDYPKARRPDVLLFLQLPLQLAHKRRQTCATFALEPLGLQDRLHFGKRFVNIMVDHDIVVLRP